MMKLLAVIILLSSSSSLFCSSATIGHRVVRDVDDRDSDGFTALHRAARDGDLEAAENLIIQGRADVNSLTNNSYYSNYTSAQEAPLHLAAQRGHKDVVQLLLSHSAEVDLTDKNGWTALQWAASRGHKDVVDVLLRHSADVNAKDFWGGTALHWAAWQGHKDVVELLLSHSADVDVDAKNKHGKTALQLAEREGYDDIVQLLKLYKRN